MIKAGELVRDFRQMLEDGWGYIPDTSGELWTQGKQDAKAATSEIVKQFGQQWVGHMVADCSGALVNSYRRHGMSIYHGSNRIARVYVAEMLPVSHARPGMAAFKARDSTKDLKQEYLPGGKYYNGDTKDYYHVGIVDDDPRYVINAKSTKDGVVRSKITDGWYCVARLKDIAYSAEEGAVAEEKYVYAESGSTVFLRKKPDTSAKYICKVPVGCKVMVVEDAEREWSCVNYKGQTGYMMDKFLVDELPMQDTGQPEEQETDTEELIAELTKAREAIERAMQLLQVG